jgi:hypothetical protein
MAKGQQRSNREAKKPKKAAAEKPKAGATSPFTQVPGTSKPQKSKR